MSMKDALEKKLKSQLEKWENEIEEMKAKAKKKEAQAETDKADAKLRQEYYDRIDELREASSQAKQKLTELRQVGEDSWEGIKSEVEKLLHTKSK